MSIDPSNSVEYRVSLFHADYLIGNDGSVWSLKFGKQHELAQQHCRQGYLYVCFNVYGRRSCHAVHKLVLESFVGPRPPGLECCHINSVRDDNRLTNLRWDTVESNIEDRRRRGTLGWHTAKVTKTQVIEIRARYASGGITQKTLGREYGLTANSISRIVLRASWKEVHDVK